uniref:Torsin-1A-interacting protein 1/2 AAA+ activator domain-containing protein n=1 Tax=Gasterosteus aculeatus aculeatus TaxID=481459 RepID=A0AAQ4P528_GASAC
MIASSIASTGSDHLLSFSDMAARQTEHRHTADAEGPEAHIAASDEGKPEETNQRLSEAGERMVPPAEGSSPPEDATPTVEDQRNALWADEESQGDHTRQVPANEQRPKTTEKIPSDALQTTSTLTLDGKDDGGVEKPSDSNTPDSDAGGGDVVDEAVKETPASTAPDTDTREADESSPGKEEKVTEERNTISAQRVECVETIGPTPETADVPPAAVNDHVIDNRRGTTLLIAAGLLVLGIAVLWQHLLQSQSPPHEDEMRPKDIFLRQLEKVKTQFPHQRAEVWSRSQIHLLRHLQTAQPTEPVSLILTAGRGGERTLRCLAQRLASAFSSALNASVLHIDGASEASQDSDQVKLDIDSKLQGAFEGDKPVAVINRFEELPPGATLIFYRYCDHENAAYKKAFMIFTVLLGGEEEIPAETRLTAVEEMVDDHLQKKFLSEGHPVSFDRMDLDKYGGLWSRISHLILPVAAEQKIEHEGC